MNPKNDISRNSSDPENWVDKYGDFLYRYALVQLRSPALAEDVVQETFLAALEKRQNFAGRSTERTWLVGILKHKVIDHFRRDSRSEVVDDFDSLKSHDGELFDHTGRWKTGPAAWTMDSSKILEQNEFLEVLKSCLSELPDRLAKAFLLRELEEMSTNEVCKVLSISATNLWVILHRARNQLQQCLGVSWFGQKTEKDS